MAWYRRRVLAEYKLVQQNIRNRVGPNVGLHDISEYCLLNSAWWLTFKNRTKACLLTHGKPVLTEQESITLMEFILLCAIYQTSPESICANPEMFRQPLMPQQRFFEIMRSFEPSRLDNWGQQNAAFFHEALRQFTSMSATLSLTEVTSILVDDEKYPFSSVTMTTVMNLQRTFHRNGTAGPQSHIACSPGTGLILANVPQMIGSGTDEVFEAVLRRATRCM
jgi:hypothetical protein